MWSLRHVEKLDLQANRISQWSYGLQELPHYIGLFKDLKYLYLEHNSLTSLPTTLQLCQELEELKVNFNRLNSLPGYLLHFPKLKVISRHDNPFDFNISNIQPHPIEDNINIGPGYDDGKKKKKGFSCDSLCVLSAKTVVKHMHVFTVDDVSLLQIPKTLRESLYDMFKTVAYCNHCHKGITIKEGKTPVLWLLDLLSFCLYICFFDTDINFEHIHQEIT